MSAAEFIGDEVTAAGYRLAGIETQIADSASVLTAIRQACERASLVLVGSSAVAGMQSAELDELLASESPPVLVVPDIPGRQPVPDIAARIYKQLGMLE